MRRRFLSLLLAGLYGCAGTSDYKRPALDLPTSWGQAPQKNKAQENWWVTFKDPALDSLMKEGLQKNSDLLLAAARVSEARAVLGLRGAERLPQLKGTFEAGRSYNALGMQSVAGSGPLNIFTLSGLLSYEIDLWGRLANAEEGARALLLSTDFSRQSISLTITCEIILAYLNLRTLDEQVNLLEQMIEANRKLYKIQEAQHHEGVLDILAFNNAKSQLASLEAQLPPLRQRLQEQENALKVLVGRNPKQIVEGKIHRGKSIKEIFHTSPFLEELPSTLLERRPDIKAVEQKLIAAEAQVSVARAAYFPTLSLSALLGSRGTETGQLLSSSSKTWQVGSSVALPLIDFGRVEYQVEGVQSQRDQAIITYRQTVQKAFQEAINALLAQKNTAEKFESDCKQFEASQENYRITQCQYDEKYKGYADLLQAHLGALQGEYSFLEAKRALLACEVNLYKALGGAWQNRGNKK